ncbi:GNAT family N-acetyltransferase [Clostridium weizhouense]|uniref:GNAT family N-acetyltransferase n=1 Tax=Clostridium weizhouense TaxID=2859781 RepID=A0ABS7AQS4_9CLOT|nr:GNAT family protein [Clostridium weizhouense]MBW6411032.1 GNAT family N-acetyltransferase [Clostridium weizhouense]
MLKGSKIYLRLIEIRDLRQLYNLCNDKEVKKYNSESIELGENKNLIKDISDRVLHGKKVLSIINEKKVLVGFMTYSESIISKGTYLIGATIGQKFWNRGYGKDSVNTLINYLFNDLKAERIKLKVVSENLRAINCYKRCGFIEKDRKQNKYYIDGKYMDIIIMEITPKDIVI